MPLLAAVFASIMLPGFVPFSTGPHGGVVLQGVFPESFRAGYVYLPPGYDPSHRYPVVYLLHGMPGSPTEYLAGTNLAAFADEGISAGHLRPFIAVMPAAGLQRSYNGEWAGIWEHELVDGVVPFMDEHLSTIPTPAGRVLAGLSAGGFGAVYIGIHHPEMFGRIESWSGYFRPLHDGPFRDATNAQLRANDPSVLVDERRRSLARYGVEFFLSSGPCHSHWFRPAQTWAFARQLRALGRPVSTFYFPERRGQWRAQLDDGLAWAFGGPASRNG